MTEVMTETDLQQLAERGAAELEGAVGESLNGWRRLIEQAVEQRHASVSSRH